MFIPISSDHKFLISLRGKLFHKEIQFILYFFIPEVTTAPLSLGHSGFEHMLEWQVLVSPFGSGQIIKWLSAQTRVWRPPSKVAVSCRKMDRTLASWPNWWHLDPLPWGSCPQSPALTWFKRVTCDRKHLMCNHAQCTTGFGVTWGNATKSDTIHYKVGSWSSLSISYRRWNDGAETYGRRGEKISTWP